MKKVENQIESERVVAMSFAGRLKQAMRACNVTQAELSAATGIGRSGICQYCSGKNMPGGGAVKAIAEALGVSEGWLKGEIEEKEAATSNIINLPIATAARLMGVSPQFIRVGLQTGKLPFGYAVSIAGGRYTYYISPKRFAEHTGIELRERIKKEAVI